MFLSLTCGCQFSWTPLSKSTFINTQVIHSHRNIVWLLSPVVQWISLIGLQRTPLSLPWKKMFQEFSSRHWKCDQYTCTTGCFFRWLKHTIFTSLISVTKLTGKQTHINLDYFHGSLSYLLRLFIGLQIKYKTQK